MKYQYCTDLDWFKNPNLKKKTDQPLSTMCNVSIVIYFKNKDQEQLTERQIAESQQYPLK